MQDFPLSSLGLPDPRQQWAVHLPMGTSIHEHLRSLGQADVLLGTSEFLKLCVWGAENTFGLSAFFIGFDKEITTCSKVLLEPLGLLGHCSKCDVHSNTKNLKSVRGSWSSGTSTATFPQASSLPTQGTWA